MRAGRTCWESRRGLRRGIPGIDEWSAWMVCGLFFFNDTATTEIYTGEVRDLATGKGKPLVFHGGEYRPLG